MIRKIVAVSVACALLVSFAGGAGGVSRTADFETAHDSHAQSATANESFDVARATAENTTVGGTTTVVAEITNPNPESATQIITLRAGYESEVVDRAEVTIPGNSSTTVEFPVFVSEELIESAGSNPGGWNFFTVQTHDHGEAAWYVLEERSEAANETA